MNQLIENLITSMVSSKVETIATKLGISTEVAKKGVAFAVPLIIGYLSKNTSTNEGKQELSNALTKHEDTDGSIDLNDGIKALGHILGNDKQDVIDTMASKTGLENSQANDMMGMLSSLVLGGLGQAKKQENLDAGGVGDLLSMASGMLGGSTKADADTNSEEGGILNSLLTATLDKDKDGSYQDDLLQQGADMLMGKLFGNKG